MNVDLGIWGKLTKFVIVLFVIALLLIIGQWYVPLIKQNERYRKRILDLDTQVQKERETAKQLEASVDALRHDPKAVERLARERLGYAKPGEIVIRFDEPITNR